MPVFDHAVTYSKIELTTAIPNTRQQKLLPRSSYRSKGKYGRNCRQNKLLHIAPLIHKASLKIHELPIQFLSRQMPFAPPARLSYTAVPATGGSPWAISPPAYLMETP